MRSTIIFGDKTDNIKERVNIEFGVHNDEKEVWLNFANRGEATVYHFLLNDTTNYETATDFFKSMFQNCLNVEDAKYKFEAIDDDEFYKLFKLLPEYESEKRTDEEILEYMDEAFDRVWLVRKQNLFYKLMTGEEKISADVLEKCNKEIDKVCKKYNINFTEPVNDWDYGYWSGILAALRWVMGDEKDFLDT